MEATRRDTKVSRVIRGQTINMMIWCVSKVSRVNLTSLMLTNCKSLMKNLKKVINRLISKEWKTKLNKKFKSRISKRKNHNNLKTFWWHLQKYKKVKYKLKQILDNKWKEVAKQKYKNLKIKIVKLKLKMVIKIARLMFKKYQLCKHKLKNFQLV